MDQSKRAEGKKLAPWWRLYPRLRESGLAVPAEGADPPRYPTGERQPRAVMSGPQPPSQPTTSSNGRKLSARTMQSISDQSGTNRINEGLQFAASQRGALSNRRYWSRLALQATLSADKVLDSS